jgi:hypothetical protein
MIAALASPLQGDAGFLKEVVLNLRAHNLAGLGGVHVVLDPFPKAGGVVVPHSLGVSKRFQNRV